jgi:hypothetical protein
MANKYEKMFVTKDKPNYKSPAYLHPAPKTPKRLAYIDETTVPGAEFGCENFWLLPGGAAEQTIMVANTQPYDRFFGFFAFNYDNIRDRCAEMEVYIGGESIPSNGAGPCSSPAGLEVGPLTFRNITRPIFFTIEFSLRDGAEKINSRRFTSASRGGTVTVPPLFYRFQTLIVLLMLKKILFIL